MTRDPSGSQPGSPPAPTDHLLGTGYRTLALLGQGGMGAVFLAEDPAGRKVVVKLLHPTLPADRGELVERFRLEARALAHLSHPNVVEVLDFGATEQGRPFIVMERLQGRTLGQELRRRGAFSAPQAIEMIRQGLRGLGAAHALGLIHRDVKLDNLFLHEPAQGVEVVKLIDFGIAKVLDASSRVEPVPVAFRTHAGVVIGTPRYLSPEQAASRSIDYRSDLYSVGIVLYTLLAGRSPFHNLRKDLELIRAHLKEVPPLPSEVASEPVPVELERVVMRALEKDPDDRFQTAAEFEAALADVARIVEKPDQFATTLFVRRSELLDSARSPLQSHTLPITQAPGTPEAFFETVPAAARTWDVESELEPPGVLPPEAPTRTAIGAGSGNPNETSAASAVVPARSSLAGLEANRDRIVAASRGATAASPPLSFGSFVAIACASAIAFGLVLYFIVIGVH